MKHTLLIIAVLMLFSLTAAASDTTSDIALDTPFEEMTLQQLQDVDRKSLSKADRKTHKKALRAAKKAEKKRIKEERKRQKAAEKARKKHNKWLDKQLALIERVYQRTVFQSDEFEAYTTIRGASHTNESALFGPNHSTVDTRFWISAFYFPENSALRFRLYISRRIGVSELTVFNIDHLPVAPEQYATRKGYWPNYVRATLRGGVEKQLETDSQYFDTCSTLECHFREVVSIELDTDDLSGPLQQIDSFDIKISKKNGRYILVNIPPAYIIGFMKRFAEVSSEFSYFNAPIAEIEAKMRALRQ